LFPVKYPGFRGQKGEDVLVDIDRHTCQ
jgi:hypothetical protein